MPTARRNEQPLTITAAEGYNEGAGAVAAPSTVEDRGPASEGQVGAPAHDVASTAAARHPRTPDAAQVDTNENGQGQTLERRAAPG